MSKVRDLPETVLLEDADLIYAVDTSEGPNAGRKATIATLRTAVVAAAQDIPYNNNDSTLDSDNVKEALDELDGKVNNHDLRHLPDGSDPLATAAPNTIIAGVANLTGTANSFSRSDHQHAISTAAPSASLSPATSNSEGSASSLSRSDHSHAIATALTANITTILPDDAADAGASNTFARGDHKHAIATATPSAQTPDQSNSEGVSTSFARADHIHNIATANVSTVGTANSQGAASSFARSDHVHNHGVQTDPTLHADATPSTDGFMTAADKTKLDTLVFGFLSYSNNGTQSTTQNNTALTAVVVDTDTGSFANSLLTKSSTTQFRTDFNGYIRISFKIRAQDTSSNDVAWRASVLKNGTEITHTRSQATGKTNAERYNSLNGSFLLACATNDLFTVGYSNAESATDTITIAASGASINVHAMYKTS